jgi:hypothetical protein
MQAEGPQSFEVVEHTLLGRIAALGGRRLKETWLTWWRGRPQGPDPNIALGWPVLAAPVTTGRRRTPSQREYDELWDHAWRTTARLILAVHDLAERSGARLVLVSVPSRLQVEEGVRDVLRSRWPGLRFDVTRINRALAELAEHNRIDYVDLLPAFEHAVHAGARSPYHTWEDEHWTPAGHRMAAAAVASHLAQAPRFAE